ncbi:MAG: hypothetical protein OEV44_00270 [Spirochaetota bacterium]|nr:hypothetical protein [Spirochaetota bacterium]
MHILVEKLIIFQVKSNISEETMCSDIGIARMTYYNLKNDNTTPHKSTLDVIIKYILKNNIDVI